MSTLSSEMIAIAKQLLAEFGENAVFERRAIVDYDVQAMDGVEELTQFSGYVYPSNYTNHEIDGEIIQGSDLKILASEMATVPDVGDLVTVSSRKYKIVDVKSTKLSGDDVLYTIQARV